MLVTEIKLPHLPGICILILTLCGSVSIGFRLTLIPLLSTRWVTPSSLPPPSVASPTRNPMRFAFSGVRTVPVRGRDLTPSGDRNAGGCFRAFSVSCSIVSRVCGTRVSASGCSGRASASSTADSMSSSDMGNTVPIQQQY